MHNVRSGGVHCRKLHILQIGTPGSRNGVIENIALVGGCNQLEIGLDDFCHLVVIFSHRLFDVIGELH